MTVEHLPAVVEDRALAPTEHVTYLSAEPVNPTGGRLVAWRDAALAAAALGASLAKTSFVPRDFRGKPEECTAAILYGDEIGLTPMQALQSIYVVSGRPGMYARAMVAVVLAAGHEVEQVSASDAKVVVRGRRRGASEWTVSEWTTERARRAKYTTNAKYETDPQAMLYARAAADVCRRVAPDALAGLAYTVEELELSEPATARVTRATTKARVQRAVTSAPEPVEPGFDDPEPEPAATQDDPEAEPVEAEPAEDTAPTVPAATTAQVQKLAILLGEHGITDRDDRLAYVSEQIGRPIASSRDLNKAEASVLINALSAEQPVEES